MHKAIDQKGSMKNFLLLAGVLLALSGLRAQATSLAYDNFNDAAGYYNTSGTNADLVTSTTFQNPPTYGFPNAWAGPSTGFFSVSTTNLSMSGLSNGGGSLSLTPTANGNFSRADYRNFTPSSGSTTLWTGALLTVPSASALNSTTNPGATDMMGFLTGNLQFNNVNTSTGATWSNANSSTLGGFAFGVSNLGTGGIAVVTLTYQTNADGLNTATAAAPIVTQTASFTGSPTLTYWLVANLTVNTPVSGIANDTLNLYLETSVPSATTIAGQTPLLTYTGDILSGATTDAINTLQLYSGETSIGNVTNNVSFDDVGIATTYNDLVAAPEPSTLALMVTCLIGAVVFGAFRRRLSFV